MIMMSFFFRSIMYSIRLFFKVILVGDIIPGVSLKVNKNNLMALLKMCIIGGP